MLKCITTVALPGRMPVAPIGPGSVGAAVGEGGGAVKVWLASTSTFSGNDTVRSMKERAVSKPLPAAASAR